MTHPAIATSVLSPRHPRRRRLLGSAMVLLVASLAIAGFGDGLAGNDGATGIEVQISRADGFSDQELQPARPIVMFPFSRRVSGAEEAARMSATLEREASGSAFVGPSRVAQLIEQRLLASAYDSLMTRVATIQPSSSFSLLTSVANQFSARHALVPVNVSVDRTQSRYAIDLMFVLLDLETGQPRLIMSAGDSIEGKPASDRATQARLEMQALRAVLGALREPS